LDKLFLRQRPSESQAESSGAKRQKREKETPGRQLPDFLWKGTPLPNNNYYYYYYY
jgi:hypothetical protein